MTTKPETLDFQNVESSKKTLNENVFTLFTAKTQKVEVKLLFSRAHKVC